MKRLPSGFSFGHMRLAMALLITTFWIPEAVSAGVSNRPARSGMPMTWW